MSHLPPPIVGSIVERSATTATISKSIASSSPSGFPAVQHRSKKSAFARARETRRNGIGESENRRGNEIPAVHRSGYLLSDTRDRETSDPLLNRDFPGSSGISRFDDPTEDEWKTQMRRDNDRVIETMSEEERERHAAEILEQLGPNVGELLRKAREARAGADVGLDTPKEDPDGSRARGRKRRDEVDEHGINLGIDTMPQTPVSSSSLNKLASPRRGILIASTPSSRASSPGRIARKLRFATVTPDDVHVFQSEPTTPRKPVGLLLPPPPAPGNESRDVEMSSERKLEDETPDVQMPSQPYAEEGTPEDIRRRFFPQMPAKDPALEWIESNDTASDSEPRFDLSGALIPIADRDKLPTHLGLHHHGGSTSAGYTLSDLLLLARSSVPAQRATVLGVLSKLVRRFAHRDIPELKDRDRIRNKALSIGLVSLTEKGSVGIQAIDLVWSCVVYWDEEEVGGVDSVELRSLDAKSSQVDEGNQLEGSVLSSDPISSLPLPALLQQMTVLFDSLALPSESLSQLLSILHRFARHSVDIATAITESPRLVSNVVNSFLLTSIPPSENGSLPNTLGLDFLRTLALSSRTNAQALEGPADAILRFVTTAIPLSASPFPQPLADALLIGTLDLYTVIGRYGIYSSIATTAAEHFGRLSSSVLTASQDVSIEVKVSWMHLLSVWMVCARDPHRTTPAHDVLWSQVVGWGWGDDLLKFRNSLLAGSVEPDYSLWGAVSGALASWLEGCRVNSAKAGQEEREAVNLAMEDSWSGGFDRALVEKTASQLKQELPEAFSETHPIHRKEHLFHIAELSRALADFTRLCLACLPIHPSNSVEAANGPACCPWIRDAFPLLSSAASALLSCDALKGVRPAMLDSRDSLLFRVQFLHLRVASTFLASFAKLARSLTGGAEWLPLGIATLETLLPGDEDSAGWLIEEIVNKECTKIECSEKLQILMPFFKNLIRPDDSLCLSPLTPTPESIQRSTTQCLPAQCFSSTSSWQKVSGLPLIRDWTCITIDHLLRSGTSPILTNPDSVPDSWNASEKDLTQASLSLTRHVHESLNKSDFWDYAPNFGHVVFNCMKVFMLEHNQQQTDSNEEVFRDVTVGKLMDLLLKPYTLGHSRFVLNPSSIGLETASKEFLGSGTPFFQFYTDFVTLYDAISFSHSIFARLLLPPTSMEYAPDYRKLLWGDFGHTLRTIRTPIEDVPTVDLKQYFWPVETDPEMLGWYLRALVKWPLFGFVRMVAVHHVACNIWSDLREINETDLGSQKRARMLLVAIFKQAQGDVVKDVVRYVQVRDGYLLIPPGCYVCGEDTKRARIGTVRGLGETQIVQNVEKMFGEEP